MRLIEVVEERDVDEDREEKERRQYSMVLCCHTRFFTLIWLDETSQEKNQDTDFAELVVIGTHRTKSCFDFQKKSQPLSFHLLHDGLFDFGSLIYLYLGRFRACLFTARVRRRLSSWATLFDVQQYRHKKLMQNNGTKEPMTSPEISPLSGTQQSSTLWPQQKRRPLQVHHLSVLVVNAPQR